MYTQYGISCQLRAVPVTALYEELTLLQHTRYSFTALRITAVSRTTLV